MCETQDIRPALGVRGLCAGYQVGRPVIEGLSLALSGPGLVRLDGANGSGKSTLVEILSGYLRPLAGSASICGVEASDPKARTFRTVVRTNPALHPALNVHDHVVIAARAQGRRTDEALRRVEGLGLGEYVNEPVGNLSSGTAKKLWYAISTMTVRPVLVLDEPFNAIDQGTVDHMVGEINRWSRERLVLLVSHLPPEGLSVARTVVLR